MASTSPGLIAVLVCQTRNFVMARLTKNPRLNEAFAKPDSKAGYSLFRSDRTGTGIQILAWLVFSGANRLSTALENALVNTNGNNAPAAMREGAD
jgi:hypothetical protein